MNRRRRKAMRSVKLSWITKEPQRALVFYLINTPLPKSGFLACISSRITTVIQVVRYYQINDNWFNEPFAVSRYKLLILRHAWLNLWDKHMTTGRINQVTILRLRRPAKAKHCAEQHAEAYRMNYKEGTQGVFGSGPVSRKPWCDARSHPIAPTEFPKEQAAAEPDGRKSASQTCCMCSSRGGNSYFATPKGGCKLEPTP